MAANKQFGTPIFCFSYTSHQSFISSCISIVSIFSEALATTEEMAEVSDLIQVIDRAMYQDKLRKKKYPVCTSCPTQG